MSLGEAFFDLRFQTATRIAHWPHLLRWPFRIIVGSEFVRAKNLELTTVDLGDGLVQSYSISNFSNIVVEHENFGFFSGTRILIETVSGERICISDIHVGFNQILAQVDGWGVQIEKIEV